MHQKIFWKKEENKERKLQGLHIHPSSSYYPSQSSQNCISLQTVHEGCFQDSGELIFVFINHIMYRLGQYLEILIVHWFNYRINLHCCSLCPRKINHCLPEIGCLCQININRGNILRLSEKNCRVLVCAAAEYCPLEGYFGRKEDWWTGCLRQH